MSRAGKLREKEVDALLAVAGRADDRREGLDLRHVVAGFLGRFTLRAFDRVLSGFQPARNGLDERFFGRLAILLHKHEIPVGASGQDRDGVSVTHDFTLRLASIRKFHFEQIHADDLARVFSLT